MAETINFTLGIMSQSVIPLAFDPKIGFRLKVSQTFGETLYIMPVCKNDMQVLQDKPFTLEL